MTHLSLALLGPIQVTLAGQPITPFKYDKVGALLVYLAVEAARAHEREALMGLFWPDLPEEAARNNLRQALVKLRDAIGDRAADPPFLLTSRAMLQFDRASDHQLDVAVFTALLDACDHHPHRHPESCKTCAQQLQQAVALYQGPFLAEFFLPDSAAFEEWALVKREGLHRRMVDALGRLVRYHERCSHYPQALLYAQRQLTLEPWAEETHRQLMRLHLLNGDRTAALAQYESCRRVLAAELDVAPEVATVALYEQIHREDLPDTRYEKTHHLATAQIQNQKSKIQNRLPLQLTPFVGRAIELTELSRLLDRPECRLVTITGAGGIGKTRLALQAAAAHGDDFTDGIFFVPLVGVTTAHFLPHAILAALGIPLQAQPSADEQLRALLQKQELLLVLDNYEQLLPDVKLLLDILCAAPSIVLLVTSRERLALQAEWLFALDGLSHPPAGDSSAYADGYEAGQLFVQRVQQTQRTFIPTRTEDQAIRRICQLVEGMPLALELTAAAVREQSCATIVTALEQGRLPASTPLHDRPDRHCSMEAVFAQSWRLLSVAEARVLRALSVFRGGFLVEAAETVAGATPAILAALVDKSLLRRNRAGRYDLHELVRQYANEQLAECGEFDAVQKRYTSYFLKLSEEAQAGMDGRQQSAWMMRIEQDIDNLRAVLKWLALHAAGDGLYMTSNLYWLWQSRSYLQEGRDWLAVTLAHSASVSSYIRAKAYDDAGFLAIVINKIEEAEELFAQSLALYQQLDPTDRWVAEGLARVINHHGVVSLFRGDYPQAVQLCRQGLAVAQQSGDQMWASSALYFAGEAFYLQGLFDRAKSSYEESRILNDAVGNLRQCGHRFTRLGHVACALGDLTQASTLFSKGLMLATECHDLVGIGMALIGLARMAASHGDYQRATILLAAKEEMTVINPIVCYWPMDRTENERTLTILHAQLDDATFATSWTEGRALSLEQAVAYALADEA